MGLLSFKTYSMKNRKKFLPGPIALLLWVFILGVMCWTWGKRFKNDAFNVLGDASVPLFLGLFIGIILFGMYLLVEFIMWYDNWRER